MFHAVLLDLLPFLRFAKEIEGPSNRLRADIGILLVEAVQSGGDGADHGRLQSRRRADENGPEDRLDQVVEFVDFEL